MNSNNGFCEQCGEKIINTCPNCHHGIKGYYRPDNVIDLSKHYTSVPNYCNNCGEPYPWTQRTLEGTKELINLSDLDHENKGTLNNIIPYLLNDGPFTKVAIAKYKKIAPKAEKDIIEGLKSILLNLASEAVKKTLFGD